MEITGEYRLKGTRQEVWNVLNDPGTLEKAIPGTDRLIVEGPDRYSAEMSVGIGMIRGKFSGSVAVEDKVEPESYRMLVDGKGAAGWLKGDGKLKLSEAGDGVTVVNVDGEASVGGLLARVGQRMVHNVANSLMKQFVQNVEKQMVAARK
ncbi:MAG: carbon monoxide dehydrogenase subunit G [Chloroflexi bacterium]|nr:carbon monoxide dehydrogenase subunit G [Chloroflexota bacterium]